MAELTYRAAVARGLAQEMERDERVLLIGEDVAGAGGVFKTTEGLYERFGPTRVRDTPISEEAITGLVMGGAMNGLRPVGEIVDTLGTARVVRSGSDITIAALAAMVPRALEAASVLAGRGVSAEVVDMRSLVPLDTTTLYASVAKTSRLATVEENPRLLGWGAEVASLVAEEMFWDLDGPIVRITTPHIPLPAADSLEDLAIPSTERIVETILRTVG